LANHKQELSMAVIEILYRLSDFREDFFRDWPTRNKIYLWQPCLLTDWNKISNLYRGSSIHIHVLYASYQVSVHLAKRSQRRLKCNKLHVTDDGHQVMAKAHIAFGKMN